MKNRRLSMAMAVFCLLGACGGGGEDPFAPVSLDFAIVESSANGFDGDIRTPRFATVRSDAEWQSLWAEYKGRYGKAAPPVDFGSRMVIGVFIGARPSGCFTTEIRRVIQEQGAIRVEYADRIPESLQAASSAGLVSCTQVFVYPSVLAAIARSDLPVSFLKV
jgi:hypothetical protein